MEKNQLNIILSELYAWNPKLRSKEGELIKLIEALSEAKPDTHFDKQFAFDLKKDLLSHRILLEDDEGLEENTSLFNFNNMNKKLYFSLGVVALAGLAVVAILINSQPAGKISFNQVLENTDQFVQAGPGAFGSLAKLGQGENAGEVAKIPQVMAIQEGGDNSVSAPHVLTSDLTSARLSASVSSETVASSDVAVSAVAPAIGLGGGDIGGDYAKMIWPMQSFEYVYTGEALELNEETSLVYRRIKGDGSFSGNINSLIGGQKIGALNLNAFSDLQSTYISFNENKPFGYGVNIDLKEENIYIGQNWPYWQSERDKCGDNGACWESYRLKINDVPSDDSLIAMASKFLSDKKINYSSYGEPRLDNFWRFNYESARDKNDYYIPEEMSVIYPLIVDNQLVYDQSGGFEGLRVNVNLLHKRVSGLSNLTTNRYESSEYALETDSQKILKAAARGGSRFYYNEGAEKVTLELGTPTKSLIKYWRYNNGQGEELLVPALVFPVKNIPDNYYGSRSITIPLVREMLDELINENAGQDIGIMPVMPMAR